MAASDDFTFVANAVSPDYARINSARVQTPDVPFQQALRAQYPDLNLTVIPLTVAPFLQYAALGHASAELDTSSEAPIRWRGIIPPPIRGGGAPRLGDSVQFAKYNFVAQGKTFIVYIARFGFVNNQYILTEPGPGEDQYSHCKATDALLWDVKDKVIGNDADYVYFFDDYWQRSRELYLQVQKASWSKVILDEALKSELQDTANNFFDSRDVYERYGVPWKRGLIFHGPPGNGKTISIKAMMKSLFDRPKDPIPSLYVRHASYPFHIGTIFKQARQMAPCCLIFEDVETIVTPQTRSYFFNEIDGISSNDGILVVASTNYLDRLDPGLTKRPSRFDRKYNFPLPNLHERELYAQFWQRKLEKAKSDVPFPDKLCPAIAEITPGFSFAFLQEAFVSTMLAIARGSEKAEDGEAERDISSFEDYYRANGNREEFPKQNMRFSDAFRAEFDSTLPDYLRSLMIQGSKDAPDDDELRRYKLWRVFKHQAEVLRKQIEEGDDEAALNMARPPRDRFATAHAPPEGNSSDASWGEVVCALTLAREPGFVPTLGRYAGEDAIEPVPTPQELSSAGLGKGGAMSDRVYIWQ